MKKLVPFLFLFCMLASCMSFQTVTFTDSEQVEEIFADLPDTKNQLYLKAHDWMITTFGNAESVIQHQDKEEGIIMGKYLLAGSAPTSGYGGSSIDTRIYAKIEIQVKDNKARIIIIPLNDWKYDPNGMTIYDYSKERAIMDMDKLVIDFRNHINKKRNDDW